MSKQSPGLLDQYGNPIERQALTQLQAEPGLISVRQAWTQTVASGLTPQKLAAILLNCDQGEQTAYLALAEEMEERDPHYASVLGTRKRAVSAVKPTVTAASEDVRDMEIAEAVRTHIAKHGGFPDLVEDLLDGLGKGFAVVEIEWETSATLWKPSAFHWRNPQWFRFDRETGQELRLIDEADPVNGVALRPWQYIQHRPKLKSGLPSRGGLARLVAFSWMCKAYTLKDWMAFVEIYGLPLRLGRYGKEATKADVDTLFRAVANIGTDAAAVLPRHMEIDFTDTGSGSDTKLFEGLANYIDSQVSKAVLGQTMTTDSGSSRSQAEVHDGVRHDLAAADARQVSGPLNRDLVVPFVALNFGGQERYPTLSIEVLEPEDVNAIIDNGVKLASAGVRIKASELRAKAGFSDPDDDDEVIGGVVSSQAQTPPPPSLHSGLTPVGLLEAGDTSPASGARTETAQNREAVPADPYAVLDEIEYEALKDWEPVMGELLDPVQAIIQSSESYEEAIALLATAIPDMGTGKLIDSLVKATTQARIEGDLNDG
jgi:phage gp29-like protein